MGSLSPAHWLLVALVVLVLFGSTKLPTFARSIGRSMRIFKSEVKGMHDDDAADAADDDETSARPQTKTVEPPSTPVADSESTAKDRPTDT